MKRFFFKIGILFLGTLSMPLFCFSMVTAIEEQSPRTSPVPSSAGSALPVVRAAYKKYDLSLMQAQAHSFMRRYKQAFIHYSVAASLGSAEGIDRLGVMYSLGQGVQKNNKISVQYFKKAALLGYSPSVATLFSLLEEDAFGLVPEERPLVIEALQSVASLFPSYAERIRSLD
jgi:TPR repeat protein